MALGFRLFGSLLPFIGLAIGACIFLTGLWLLLMKRSLTVGFLGNLSFGSFQGINQIFMFGIAYALASLSCALPVFLSAVGIVVGSGVSGTGVANVLVGSLAYSLGMGLIMMSVTVAVLYFEDATQRLVGILIPYVEVIGKLAMVAAGAYIVVYWMIGDGAELLRYRMGNI
jgi:cytochrome c-type biogenesis protein